MQSTDLKCVLKMVGIISDPYVAAKSRTENANGVQKSRCRSENNNDDSDCADSVEGEWETTLDALNLKFFKSSEEVSIIRNQF